MTLAAERTEDMPHMRERPRTLLQRAFFARESVLKVMLNSRNECYFQWGWKQGSSWSWKKVKFSDIELGEILAILEGRGEKKSFFHSYEHKGVKNTTQIWVHRSDGFCTFKVKEASKSLSTGEQMVLAVLIRHAIVMMSLEL
jgi:hypothetical protein